MLKLVLKHYNNYHHGKTGLFVDYCGNANIYKNESGVYSNAYSDNNFAWVYDGSLTIVYHHNDGDGGRAVDVVYGSVSRYVSWSGIFYDEDMVAIYDETGSTN